MRRTLGAQRRRVALVVIPLAAVFTVLTASEGLWILAVPGAIYCVVEALVFIRSRPRRGASPPPGAHPSPPPGATSTPPSPRVIGAPRHTSPRDRAAARRPGRRG